jgi:hypothetical protein
MNERQPRPKKKPYSPPEIRKVKLQPQGAVLGVCKNNPGISGPGGPNCNAAVNPCSTFAS